MAHVNVSSLLIGRPELPAILRPHSQASQREGLLRGVHSVYRKQGRPEARQSLPGSGEWGTSAQAQRPWHHPGLLLGQACLAHRLEMLQPAREMSGQRGRWCDPLLVLPGHCRTRCRSAGRRGHCRSWLPLAGGLLLIPSQRGRIGPTQQLSGIDQVRIANFRINFPQTNPTLPRAQINVGEFPHRIAATHADAIADRR